MAGRLAPFIELGVGFNVELTARENVVLNGVMMGLTPQETRDRLDAVIEFAELEDFVDLKLKNYSSGMLVRLAFSLMMEADADILLIDEVLAVGDAAFQQKCADAFREMKAAGKTIVLVTHEMAHGRGILPPRDADRRRQDPRDRRPRRGRPRSTCGSTSSRRQTRPTRQRRASDEVRDRRRLGRGRRRRSGRPTVEHGEAIRLRAELEVLRRRSRDSASASSSPTPTASASSSSAAPVTDGDGDAAICARASGSTVRCRAREPAGARAATSSTAESTRRTTARDLALRRTTRSTSSSSAARATRGVVSFEHDDRDVVGARRIGA